MTERSTTRRRKKPKMAYTLFTTTTEALVFSISYSHHNKQTYWFSNMLQYYICRKSHFYGHYKETRLRVPTLSSHSFANLFNLPHSPTGCAGWSRMMTTLKTQLTVFWKYVSNFKWQDNLISYTWKLMVRLLRILTSLLAPLPITLNPHTVHFLQQALLFIL